MHRLTPAERRVLSEVLRGGTTRDIATALFVTEATVRTHLTRIYDKLGVRGRIELLAKGAVTPASTRTTLPLASTSPATDSPLLTRSGHARAYLYVPGLLAAAALLAQLIPFSVTLAGPTLLAAHVVMARQHVASPGVRLAALVVGALLSAEQIAVLAALHAL